MGRGTRGGGPAEVSGNSGLDVGHRRPYRESGYVRGGTGRRTWYLVPCPRWSSAADATEWGFIVPAERKVLR